MMTCCGQEQTDNLCSTYMIDRPGTSGWTVDSLVVFFGRRGVPDDAYSIYADRNESYCLAKVGWRMACLLLRVRSHLGWAKNEPQALDLLKVFVLQGCIGVG